MQVFFAMAVFLGEGIYHFLKIFVVSLVSFLAHSAAERRLLPVKSNDVDRIEARTLTLHPSHSKCFHNLTGPL